MALALTVLLSALVVLLLAVDAGFLVPIALFGVLIFLGIVVWAHTRERIFVVSMLVFVLQAHFTPAITPAELVFALVIAAHYAFYALRAAYTPRIEGSPDGFDVAIAGLLIGVAAAAAYGLVRGNEPFDVLRDVMMFSMLIMFYPARALASMGRRGQLIILGTVLFVGLFAFTRNLIFLYSKIVSAEHAWEIARSRVAVNEILLFLGAIASLCFVSITQSNRGKTASFIAFTLCSIGVILTQYRMYYVALGVAAVLTVALSPRGSRKSLALLLIGGVVGLIAAVLAVVGPVVTTLLIGLLDRFVTLSAGSVVQDVSLLTRMYEADAALSLIYRQPIVGYGLGNTFGYFDVIEHYTWVKSFAHNSYLSLALKLGSFWTIAFVCVWVTAIFRSARSVWDKKIDSASRMVSVFCFVCLLVLTGSSLTTSTFTTPDTIVMFGLLFGLSLGIHDTLGHHA